MLSQTSRSPNGLTNAQPGATMQNAKMLDPSLAQVYHNDFNTFVAADLTATLVGTGTIAVTATDGGAVLVTTTAGIADANYYQVPVAGFKLTAGKAAYFKFKGTLSNVLTDVFYAGLVMTSATPLTANDSLFIRKATAAATLELVSRIGGVETVAAFPAAALLVAATAFELGIEVEPNGTVNAYFNPPSGSYPTNGTTLTRDPVAKLVAPSLTAVLLAPSFGVLNSAAAARTLSVVYITAVRER